MTVTIHSCERSFHVLHCCVRPRIPRTVLWIVSIAPSGCLIDWSWNYASDDGNSLPRICSSLRTDELLRSDRNYELSQPSLCRTDNCWMNVGGFSVITHLKPILWSSLPSSFRNCRVNGTSITALHQHGSSNPLGTISNTDKISFDPYFTAKDLFGAIVFVMFFSFWIYFAPNYLGHPDNYIEADPMVTPAHIVPEWYFLCYYAILRAIPNKLLGVLALFASILVLALLPFITASTVQSSAFRPLYRVFVWLFAVDWLILTWLGGCLLRIRM